MRLAGRMTGVTLIELLTVVAVVAILGTLAVANYRKYLLRTNRTDATTALLRIQVAEEKFYLQKNTYTTDLTALGLSATTTNGYYTLRVAPDPASTNDILTSYVATATAVGGQTDDASCLTLGISDRGLHQSSPSASSTCWR
jgi:type IV pilus assembly protein PilE